MSMTRIYKQVMLQSVLKRGGAASKDEIAGDILASDVFQRDHYRKTVVDQMPGKRLVRDGALVRDGDIYCLAPSFNKLSENQRIELIRHFPDNPQFRGDSTLGPSSREQFSLCSHLMTGFFGFFGFRKAIFPYFPSSSHTSPVIVSLPSIFSAYAGTGIRRRSSIKAKTFWNKRLDTATSANWKVT